jgi:mRNA interferase MazF
MVTQECVSRRDIYLVTLNPTRGSEIRKKRPCVVVSPDELNAHLRTFIVAPLTTGGHP